MLLHAHGEKKHAPYPISMKMVNDDMDCLLDLGDEASDRGARWVLRKNLARIGNDRRQPHGFFGTGHSSVANHGWVLENGFS